ncbi:MULTISPECIES: DUF749 domain-containing protein [Methanothermobacter]|uniref:DUF749 domain-containing protein n=1 Tax=Methanothermobacter marburgensis (strain ATCC BAA-927 / DSM 2133 / JCM 14651 / NBRC 100331 / OCM 82 / Marburg) TaxID=79929 RepID=D9PV05_METTM|nr:MULTISPECIES: DUF749 domain-containing protein [Methanothermobacter]ADL58052.1 conserved hypothetical protein [Methanothermobacter marburgensis str. Marburg]MCG2829371.1 DUF749 domain-containing protein [Methanothermobacter sp. K4]MDI9615248.1 DUF749 domain-containing protein [Methanothermobacter sp.]QHN08487.1 DUF749 domain-containing protein [Methanothermobacter sp. THM-2]WBF10238.1 DUF749 domain-containing protein [Methanothermobacter marburgensis]
MFIATLKGIFTLKDLPEEFKPFVDYKAGLEKKELSDDDEVAILSIQGTQSNHVLILSSYSNVEEIRKELEEAGAKINHTTLKILEGHL